MKLLKRELPKTHRIILASDLHHGAIASHINGWKKMLQRVEDEENTYLALGGDLVEAIAVDDPRWAIGTQDTSVITPLAQMLEVSGMLEKIRKKILFVLTGNHEIKHFKIMNLTQHMCDLLEVPYGAYSTKMHVLSEGKTIYKFLYTHGRWGFNSTADDPVRRLSNMQISVKRKLQPLAGDCVVMACGHSHKLIVAEPEQVLYMTDNGTSIKSEYTTAQQHGKYIDPNLRWYVNTGSFLKTFISGDAISYSEQFGYAPTEIGFAEIVCDDGLVTGVERTVL